MARLKPFPLALLFLAVLMLLANQQARRPVQFHDRRPTAQETWGELMTFGSLVIALGGWTWPPALQGAKLVALKCARMGGRWCWRDPWSEMLMFRKLHHSDSELFTKCWEEFLAYQTAQGAGGRALTVAAPALASQAAPRAIEAPSQAPAGLQARSAPAQATGPEVVDKNAENDANLMQVALSVEEGSKGTKGAGRGRGQPKQKGGKPKGQSRVKGGKEEHTDKGAGKGNVKDNGKASQSGGGGGSPEGASAEEIKTLISTMRLVSQAALPVKRSSPRYREGSKPTSGPTTPRTSTR